MKNYLSSSPGAVIRNSTVAPKKAQLLALNILALAVGVACSQSSFAAIAIGTCGSVQSGTNASVAQNCAGASASNPVGGAIAIGDNTVNPAVANGDDTLAIESGATATGASSIAIGHQASALNSGTKQTAAIAVGSYSTAGADSSTALGGFATASGTNGAAIGAHAQAVAAGATAIGAGAAANNAGDIALGAGSSTDTAHAGAVGPYGGNAAGNATSVLSVGTAGNERQIQNVAPGGISATSTDAINGSQLYLTIRGINGAFANTAAALGGGAAFNPSSGVFTMPSYVVQGATYTNVGAALNGLDAVLTSVRSTASKALSIAQNSVQYDPSQDGSGSGGTNGGGSTSVTLNPGGASAGVRNLAPGAVGPMSNDAVNGSQLYATNQNIASVQGSVTNLTNQITNGTIGIVQQGGGTSAPITVGAQTGGTQINVTGTEGDRRISGLASGVAANDAVNVGQMNEAIQQGSSSAVNQANAYTNQQVSGLSRRLDAVGAEAMASSSLIPNARANGNIQLAVAAGTYGGATALAVGANAWLSDRLLINAHMAHSTGSGGRLGASVGATYGF
ncbi:YadA family autotransporter adhesin [Burkholderia territorii]|uniref:YadA family autotransporter adhesin n=1 Tax=Burkholderia territorii TaxID=1503055 RepID=UPI0018C88B9F|nr:YadA-like family protein [Burkholderia territorii]